MLRRCLALAAAAGWVAVAVPSAPAVLVHVRVEGKTQTIYGATEPTLSVQPPEGSVPDVPRIASPLRALEAASVAGEFYYHVTQFAFGPYVDQIGRFHAGATNGWVYKVNGRDPGVGADRVELEPGDRVLWYWAQFGIVPGGPPTLRLTRARTGCYRVVKQDDAGSTSAALGAVLHVDGRSVKTRAATGGVLGCPGPHRGLVRATVAGAVRSNAVR